MTTYTLDISSDLSSFVKRDDLADGPHKFRIRGATRETFEGKGTSSAQTRIVLTFTNDRRFSLNKTNLKTCAKAFGKNAATWTGRIVELYFNPEIEMAGQVVGGVRVRIPQPKPAMPAPPPVSADADEPDDIDAAMPTFDDSELV